MCQALCSRLPALHVLAVLCQSHCGHNRAWGDLSGSSGSAPGFYLNSPVRLLSPCTDLHGCQRPQNQQADEADWAPVVRLAVLSSKGVTNTTSERLWQMARMSAVCMLKEATQTPETRHESTFSSHSDFDR